MYHKKYSLYVCLIELPHPRYISTGGVHHWMTRLAFGGLSPNTFSPPALGSHGLSRGMLALGEGDRRDPTVLTARLGTGGTEPPAAANVPRGQRDVGQVCMGWHRGGFQLRLLIGTP